MKVLVAGFATRHIAQSAHAAGYEVYSVDHFCDQDLGFYVRESRSFDELGDLEGVVVEMCERVSPDLVIVSSGAELIGTRELCGTPPERVERFLDKISTHGFFEELGIPVPGLLPPGTYPAMIKPRKGSGGWRNAIVNNDAEFIEWDGKFGELPYLAEEVVAEVVGAPVREVC
ncbi:MAG TPA: ATP-dependent carboligase, partial [Methanoregulaceae archaeon]|nr:ATP-dependent carboligase [Methanoregulaceae archaeon]